MRYQTLFFVLFACFPGFQLAMGQTCCSGGVPISSNLGLPPETKNILQFNLNYDLNVLHTLKTGTRELNDDSRTRRTHSVLIQTGYSFTDRFSMDALFSWVRQERQIQQFGNEDFTATEGIGDAVFLFKYKLFSTHQNQTVVSGAMGVKAPLGKSNLKRDDGLTINADLQPGSGAWDIIGWAQVLHSLNFRPSMSISGTVVYGLKGKNNDYLGGQTYQFGNELQVSAAIADRLILGKNLFDPSVTFRFRHVRADRFNSEQVPSTGGTWLFFSPGLSYWLSPNHALNARADLPLYADITGTQVTPTFRINFGLFVKINRNHSGAGL